MECCKTCRYFAHSGRPGQEGVCRRRLTPILIGIQQAPGNLRPPMPVVQGFYTPVAGHGWCGEYMSGQCPGVAATPSMIEQMLKEAASDETISVKSDEDA